MGKKNYKNNRLKRSQDDKEKAPEESGALLKSHESDSITGLKLEIPDNYDTNSYEEISERSELKESVKTGSSFFGKITYEKQPLVAASEEAASDPEQPKTDNTGLNFSSSKEKIIVKRKSELLGVNYKTSGEESTENGNQSLVTGLKKNTVKDKAENIREEAEKTGDKNYHERNKASDTEATENAVSGNVKGFAVAKVKKGANTVAQTVKKGAGAAGNLTEAPENMIKGYSKAKAKKEQIEKIDVESMAKDFVSIVSHFFISIAKKVVKYLMLLIGTLGLAFVIVMLMFFLLIFIVSVAVTGYDESAATYTVSASEIENNSEVIDGFVYINQGDYSTVSMGGGQTIAQSGCGLTCLASVLATYTGNTSITPVTVINYARSHNTATSNTGAYLVCYSLYHGLANEYGVNCDVYYSVTHDYIYEALTTGKSVVVKLTSESRWTDGTAVTTSTHFVVLLAYTDTATGTIACMNPSGGKTSYIAESTILNDSGCTYMYVFYN